MLGQRFTSLHEPCSAWRSHAANLTFCLAPSWASKPSVNCTWCCGGTLALSYSKSPSSRWWSYSSTTRSSKWAAQDWCVHLPVQVGYAHHHSSAALKLYRDHSIQDHYVLCHFQSLWSKMKHLGVFCWTTVQKLIFCVLSPLIWVILLDGCEAFFLMYNCRHFLP
jgi:hypothetical protein